MSSHHKVVSARKTGCATESTDLKRAGSNQQPGREQEDPLHSLSYNQNFKVPTPNNTVHLPLTSKHNGAGDNA